MMVNVIGEIIYICKYLYAYNTVFDIFDYLNVHGCAKAVPLEGGTPQLMVTNSTPDEVFFFQCCYVVVLVGATLASQIILVKL